MSNSSGFFGGLAGGIGIGLQAKQMKNANSSPQSGTSVDMANSQKNMSLDIAKSDTGLLNPGGVGLPEIKGTQQQIEGGTNWQNLLRITSMFGGQ